MTLIEPVSSLSIKRAVNLYTIILFLSFGALLYWLATDRYQSFIDLHENTADSTSKILAFQINKILVEKQREIDIFVEDYNNLLTNLSGDTENKYIVQEINKRLKKYQPDFIEFNVLPSSANTATQNTVSQNIYPNRHDSILSQSCFEDLSYFRENDTQKIRLHSDADGYHYDIISRLSADRNDPVFLVSFSVNDISELLNSSQSHKHNLVLVNNDTKNSVGLTSHGDVKKIYGGLNFKIRNSVNWNTIAKTKVKDTNWYVVDMSDSDLFDDYRNKIIKEYAIAFYIFSMIVLFMRYILLKQDAKRSAAEEQLRKNHEQIKVLNNSLEQLSKKDSLTNLYNRRYFDEMFKHEWDRSFRSKDTLSCILLDIDHFKKYNDHYGHQAGDKCIKDISDLLKDTFRRAGDVVARYGGEEFIVALTGATEEEAKLSIVKFQLALKKLRIPHAKSETDKFVTASFGLIVKVPDKNISVEYFVRCADKALYKAKESGRNQLVIYKETNNGR